MDNGFVIGLLQVVIKVVTVGIFYCFIIFQYYYIGKYCHNNYISYLSVVSLN